MPETKKTKNKKIKKIGVVIGILSALIIGTLLIFMIASLTYLAPVDKKSDEIVEFNIPSGMGKNQIADELEKAGLIKNALFFKFYIKFNANKELYAGTYKISKSMSVDEIIDTLNKGKSLENESITVQFIEGKRLKDYAKKISEAFPYTEEEILETSKDKEFLNKLIKNYWFVTEDILNEKIYYPLEGYLFPDTYNFKKNATIEEILEKMVKTLGTKLDVYKSDIELSKYSIHELITLASIIELEGASADDRAGVAGVFYNRLKDNWTLGSDATTYYAVGKGFDRDLSLKDLQSCNGYNTRSESKCAFTGLPVGPIDSPSLASLAATFEPNEGDYYYFVADKNKKTYFMKTYKEHTEVVSKLKQEGLWYQY